MNIRLVGDVHGKQDSYINLVKDCDYSFQLGDIGFNYDKLKVLDSDKHKFIKGNHDIYTKRNSVALIKEVSHLLDDFGIYKTKVDSNIPYIFYCRGEHSIDKAYRTPGLDWFEDEQLTYYKMLSAIECYAVNKPKIVISHGCPESIITHVANPAFAHLNIKPSATAAMLEEMYRMHKPDFWFFGHYHINKTIKVNHTQFFCINELDYVDITDTENGYNINADYFRVEKITC